MARKIVNVQITAEGRDKGKMFVLTEMSARQAESWAMRALLAIMGSKADMPEGFAQMGMAALAHSGLRALTGIRYEVLEPLLAEMLLCVQIMPDPTKPHVVRDLIEPDVEEVTTLVTLRMEVWKLHTDFLQAVALSDFQAPEAAANP